MPYELIQMGQVEIQLTDAHLDVGKARIACNPLQLLLGRYCREAQNFVAAALPTYRASASPTAPW